MLTFLEPSDLSDVVFSVESRRIYANRVVLSMWSPVMKAMLNGHFCEKVAPIIDLPQKHFDDIVELVRVLHPPNKDINKNNVTALLPLAREYQIDDLTKLCEQFLQTQPASVRGLVLAKEFSLKNLEQRCLEHIHRSTLKSLLAEDGFDQLTDEAQIDIFRHKAIRYEEAIQDVTDIVTGKRPHQRLNKYGMKLPTCSEKKFRNGPHKYGTEKACNSCAVSMTERVAVALDRLFAGEEEQPCSLDD